MGPGNDDNPSGETRTMARLQDQQTVTNAGSRIHTGRSKINSATESIAAVKTDMLRLRDEVNASVTANDGLYDAADQAEVQTVLVEFKGTVTAFAAGL